MQNITAQMLANIAIHTKLIQDSSELVILIQEFGLSFPGYNPVEFFRLENRCNHFTYFTGSGVSLSQELCAIIQCMIYEISVTVTWTKDKDTVTILTSRKGEDVYVTYTLDFSYRSYTPQYIYDFILDKVLSYYTSKSEHSTYSENTDSHREEVKENVSFGPKFIEKWNAARDPNDPAGWSSLRHLRHTNSVDNSVDNSVRGAQPEHPKSEWFRVPDID